MCSGADLLATPCIALDGLFRFAGRTGSGLREGRRYRVANLATRLLVAAVVRFRVKFEIDRLAPLLAWLLLA